MEGALPTLRWNVIDWCVAISLAAFAEMQLVLFSGCCERSRVTWPAYLLSAAEALPVAWRRRFPLPLLFVTSGAAAIQVVLGTPVSDWRSCTFRGGTDVSGGMDWRGACDGVVSRS